MSDFVIKYKLPNESDWRELHLDRQYFPPNACDEDVSMEITEYLYIEIEKIDGYQDCDTSELDDIIEGLEFSRGSRWDEAVFIHKCLKGLDPEEDEEIEFFEYRLID